ncbi:hypothetical protein BaRGS_00010459, partial [Batillaria attramentaria]
MCSRREAKEAPFPPTALGLRCHNRRVSGPYVSWHHYTERRRWIMSCELTTTTIFVSVRILLVPYSSSAHFISTPMRRQWGIDQRWGCNNTNKATHATPGSAANIYPQLRVARAGRRDG